MSLTQRTIETCRQMLEQRVGQVELDAATNCLVDSLACAFAAYGEESIETLRALSIDARPDGESTVIAYGERARATDVALVNGTMISQQLFDDNQAQMRGHPSGPLLPAVLAMAEVRGLSIRQALAAFVVGYEVECRFGTLLNPSHYETGWHATATQGTLAAVVASSLIMGLDDQAMAHALGISASLAGGVRRNFGTMTMSLHSGLASSHGVRAAQLAARGFTADPQIFDGPMSFGDVFSREWSPELLERSLPQWGEPFMLVSPGATYKLYPCGRPPLFAVDCAIELQRKHGLKADDLRRIVAEASYMYPRTLIHARPQNGLQGKTSLQYCIATTFVDGRPTLASFTDEAVKRPQIAALIDMTEVRVPPHLSEEVPAVRKAPFEQPVTVSVETRDGRVFSETVPIHKGSPENPASAEELRQKFVDCVAGPLGAARIDAVLQAVRDARTPVRDLMRMLSAR